MKKHTRWISGLVTGIALFPMAAMAADYSGYSNEELAAMRGTMQNATEEERNAFRCEWQNRMQDMTPEEMAQYTGKGQGGKGNRSPQGSGQGSMKRHHGGR
ncbi:MAG: hypothetical protein K6360_07945 [Deltaproteobacteria bacterium]